MMLAMNDCRLGADKGKIKFKKNKEATMGKKLGQLLALNSIRKRYQSSALRNFKAEKAGVGGGG